jgi:1,4-alpha-glucan branching enzyme
MRMALVQFVYHTGLVETVFRSATLSGNWDAAGQLTTPWTTHPMQAQTDDAGCAAFAAGITIPDAAIGTTYQWGVAVDGPSGSDLWAVPTEISDPNAVARYRNFTLAEGTQSVEYWLSTARRFGAQKLYTNGDVAIRFSVWAPHATRVDVVFAPAYAAAASGYIDDGGGGIDPTAPVIPLTQDTASGVWTSSVATSPVLTEFSAFFERAYMYRIRNEQGAVTYKTDLWSRNQYGRGAFNPGGKPYTQSYTNLDGTVSCSVVADPDLVTRDFDDADIQKSSLVPAATFWADEYSAAHPVPDELTDLIIYELHVGSLDVATTDAGTLADAIAFIEALVTLGVNAVELLPVLEFNGDLQWGYGSSHFFCVQTSAGGGNQLKHFVKACHQRGIAVILDVVYNHFLTSDAERAEWGYDADPAITPQDNLYYWYEGVPTDYRFLEGGYVDNGSSGWAPRFWEENVRQMFTSSALMLLEEYHADGLRVDLTDALHQNNVLHANGQSLGNVNAFGTKLLRELGNTIALVCPAKFLIAEDHTGWAAMTQPTTEGGIGFDAVWYADFYHHLIGDGDYGSEYARLLYTAGFGTNSPLAIDDFAGALVGSQASKIVYHECHDTAGNESDTERTIVTAVNGAALEGATRACAEARARFSFGMAAVSAGTPMFLMGEEIGAAKPFDYNTFNVNKEDLIGDRTGVGRGIFTFFRDLIALLKTDGSLRSRSLDVVYVHDTNRVVAIHRSNGTDEALVIGNLNDNAFPNGYTISLSSNLSGQWKEVFNSDGAAYGGSNVGNGGGTRSVVNGAFTAVLPARGFVVFTRAA